MPPLVNDPIQIAIVTDGISEACGVDCGADWSSPETQALAQQRAKERFGDRIRLEFVTMAEDKADKRMVKLKQQIENDNLNLPLLLIEGEPIISGQFDIRLVLDAINAELEIRELTYEQKL